MKHLEDYQAKLGDNAESIQELRQLISLLEMYGIRDYIQFDPSVVRGLAYYTGIVFEGFDRSHTLRAICGGGRYDKLLESFGSQPIPAVGFGFGDAVIIELLAMKNLLPNLSSCNTEVVAYAMTEALREPLLKLVLSLRRAGIAVDMVLDERKPKWVFQKADKVNAKYVLFLGEEEYQEGKVMMKDLRTSVQNRYTSQELMQVLLKQGDSIK
jgi:histidyl-tRNA synthetase